MASPHGDPREVVCRPGVNEDSWPAAWYLRQAVDLSSRLVRDNGPRQGCNRCKQTVLEPEHLDHEVPEVADRLPLSIADALIYLALTEATRVGLVTPDHTALANRQTYRHSVKIHGDNVPHQRSKI